MTDILIDWLGIFSCVSVIIVMAISVLVNIWCLFVMFMLILDHTVLKKSFPEKPDNEKRRAKIKIIK
jgi:hypothetical protein